MEYRKPFTAYNVICGDVFRRLVALQFARRYASFPAIDPFLRPFPYSFQFLSFFLAIGFHHVAVKKARMPERTLEQKEKGQSCVHKRGTLLE